MVGKPSGPGRYTDVASSAASRSETCRRVIHSVVRTLRLTFVFLHTRFDNHLKAVCVSEGDRCLVFAARALNDRERLLTCET